MTTFLLIIVVLIAIALSFIAIHSSRKVDEDIKEIKQDMDRLSVIEEDLKNIRTELEEIDNDDDKRGIPKMVPHDKCAPS